MSHTEDRKYKMELMLKIVKASIDSTIPSSRLMGEISFQTGCSMNTAAEYLNVLVSCGHLVVKDGWVSLGEHQSTLTN